VAEIGLGPESPPSPYERLADAQGARLLESLAPFDEGRIAQAAALARSLADPALAHAALATAFARRRARTAHKFGRADQMFFTRAGYEQSSSESVARHRAARFERYARIADLCCGIGSDAIALARSTSARISAVDNDVDAITCARLNARVYGVDARIDHHLSDALRWPLACDAAFADPSRRSARGRERSSSAYQPSLRALLGRAAELPGHALAVKVAPGLRTDPDEIRQACNAPVELEFVSERGVCKEEVLWCGDLARHHGARRATVIDADGAHELDGSNQRAPSTSLQRWIGEPDAAVIRAGLIGALCERIDAHLVDVDVAYMTAERARPGTFVRWYEVIETMPFGVKRLRAALRVRDIGRLVVKTRAFPLRPEQIVALLKARGDAEAVLVCTTLRGSKTAILCRAPSAPMPT